MMPQVQAFIGAAGSGKTFALMEELKKSLIARPICDGQTILAITFMHGSRRRLTARLGDLARDGVPTQCDTIDSFCLRIVNRFRRYLGKFKPIVICAQLEGLEWIDSLRVLKSTFASVRKAVIELLQIACVRSSIAAAFPIIVVDEFQDCDEELLEIIRCLSLNCMVLVAADGFQHLAPDIECPAEKWLDRNQAKIEPLSGNRRTNEDVLRETAMALREGRIANKSIEVHFVPPGLAAWHISSRLTWGKISAGKSKALICPVRPESSPWFQGILSSLSNELGATSKVGPNPFKWEGAENEQLDEAIELLQMRCRGIPLVALSVLDDFELADNYTLKNSARQAKRVVRLRGEAGIDCGEFASILQQTAHTTSAFRRDRQNARVAMTVHGAKNREFDFVFIAWPYEAPANPLLARKLLYNAVTRAKEGAVLFVQGDKSRMAKDLTLALVRYGVVERQARPSSGKKKL